MNVLKPNSLFIYLLFISLLSITTISCSKDKDPDPTSQVKEQIVGSWNVTSFMQGGFELIGSIYTSETLKFDAYSGDKGVAKFTKVGFDGSVQVEDYTYTVNSSTGVITYTNPFGVVTTATPVITNLTDLLFSSDEPTGVDAVRKAKKI